MALIPRAARASASLCALSVGALSLAEGGCLNRPIDRLEPRSTVTVSEVLPSSRVEKIDLLLAIDNSVSMADKQAILADAVPDLVDRFVNPRCVGAAGPIPKAEQPAGPLDACPEGSKREFQPIVDIHVGIVSSSLGALGGDGCATATSNDGGRLVARTPGGPAETHQGQGFLAWDPKQLSTPPGESDPAVFKAALTEMVRGVGQDGCGYEMSLETVYRFLVDPAPYASLAHASADDPNEKVGLDEELLAQRAAFLRPDSLVAIIMLSDENDCSVQAEGEGWLTLRTQPFYRASSACEADPNDACCYSCGLGPPSGCSADPICATPAYSAVEDPTNFRCWEQRRRYGEDFLYPVKRYVNAFTAARIDPARPDLSVASGSEGIENPLFAGRPRNLVYFAGIVGVPWQAVAERDEAGAPTLELGFKSALELESEGAFPKLAGDPDLAAPATDPFMIEDVDKRSGTSDLTGASLPGSNPINGNDHTVTITPNGFGAHLQYACIIDFPDDPAGADCSTCVDASCDNPLCDLTTQTHAKAFPGTRQLAVVRGMQEQGVVASVCPARLDDPGAVDYGYQPAVNAIVDALKADLADHQCLPFSLSPDETGAVDCLVVEASRDEPCDCTALPGRAAIAPEHQSVVGTIQSSPYHDADQSCLCEIEQLAGDARTSCQNDEEVATGVDGWCYVDATTRPAVGSPALVADCPETERRVVRFVGKAQARAGTTLHVACLAEQ